MDLGNLLHHCPQCQVGPDWLAVLSTEDDLDDLDDLGRSTAKYQLYIFQAPQWDLVYEGPRRSDPEYIDSTLYKIDDNALLHIDPTGCYLFQRDSAGWSGPKRADPTVFSLSDNPPAHQSGACALVEHGILQVSIPAWGVSRSHPLSFTPRAGRNVTWAPDASSIVISVVGGGQHRIDFW